MAAELSCAVGDLGYVIGTLSATAFSRSHSIIKATTTRFLLQSADYSPAYVWYANNRMDEV